MDIQTLFAFLGAAIVLTIMPGPDNMFTLTQSIINGKHAGIFTTLGLCTGLLVHILAATFGLAAIIYQSSLAFSVIKYAGAAYLLYLAYKSFKAKNASFEITNEETFNRKSLYKKGVIMNILNPKLSLFFLAFLPQFVDQKNNISIQMLTLGIVFLIQTLIIFMLISIFSDKIGVLFRKSPTFSKKMNYIQGSIFTVLGLKIAFTQK
ncbi:LysE family translocator [Paenibacillus sp. WLX1005]|uniref:LysE family translocator n=1 Tax=Paenibacillus sp. WLX1005 TaxID=3243766 RepID=UPI0039844C05